MNGAIGPVGTLTKKFIQPEIPAAIPDEFNVSRSVFLVDDFRRSVNKITFPHDKEVYRETRSVSSLHS